MTCSLCGHSNETGQNQCTRCGANLFTTPSAPSSKPAHPGETMELSLAFLSKSIPTLAQDDNEILLLKKQETKPTQKTSSQTTSTAYFETAIPTTTSRTSDPPKKTESSMVSSPSLNLAPSASSSAAIDTPSTSNDSIPTIATTAPVFPNQPTPPKATAVPTPSKTIAAPLAPMTPLAPKLPNMQNAPTAPIAPIAPIVPIAPGPSSIPAFPTLGKSLEAHSFVQPNAVVPPPKREVDPLLGHQIGNYLLQKKIGKGGFGTVYRANHVFIPQAFAVKVLHVDRQTDPEVVERFKREANALAQLRHKSIVQMADFGMLPDIGFYLAMEYLEGRNLQGIIKRRYQFSIGQLKCIFKQFCDVLQYVHQEGIVHRDLKPANIFVLKNSPEEAPQIRLIDFGIATSLEDRAALTVTGSYLGTAKYISPEQGRGERDVDGRADLYSLGIILYRLLTGSLPFDAPQPLTILYNQIHLAPPALKELLPEQQWSPELEAFIQRILSKSKEDRPQTADMFWEECEIALSAQENLAPFGNLVQPTPKTKQENAGDSSSSVPFAPSSVSPMLTDSISSGSSPYTSVSASSSGSHTPTPAPSVSPVAIAATSFVNLNATTSTEDKSPNIAANDDIFSDFDDIGMEDDFQSSLSKKWLVAGAVTFLLLLVWWVMRPPSQKSTPSVVGKQQVKKQTKSPKQITQTMPSKQKVSKIPPKTLAPSPPLLTKKPVVRKVEPKQKKNIKRPKTRQITRTIRKRIIKKRIIKKRIIKKRITRRKKPIRRRPMLRRAKPRISPIHKRPPVARTPKKNKDPYGINPFKINQD